MIRDKYAELLTTEDNKKILPDFLGFVAKQKGYYDSKHKAYLHHDTSMDYLQTIVRKFKTKARIEKPTSKLIDIFDIKAYREQKVDKKQVSHIMKYVKQYFTQVGLLFNSTHISDDSNIGDQDINLYEAYQILQRELVDNINKYRIRYSTMIFILMQLEKKEYYKYRNIILSLLFTICRTSFIESVIKSQSDIDVLIEGGVDISLFDFWFEIRKNSDFLTKN